MSDCKFTLKFSRQNGKRIKAEVLHERLAPIVEAIQTSNWKISGNVVVDGPFDVGNNYVHDSVVEFLRTKKTSDNTKMQTEMEAIIEDFNLRGKAPIFAKYPWKVDSYECSWDSSKKLNKTKVVEVSSNEDDSSENFIDFEKAVDLKDLNVPEVLVSGSDSEIESYPEFEGLFDRAAHIRVIFSSLKTMKKTEGMRRNHCLLWGLPACAKSTLFNGVMKVLGPGGYLSINSNSATKAGIEKIFLHHVAQVGLPPILFIEEIEKTQEAILTTWLSIMDDRAEVRKVNFRTAQSADARVLCIATANDKVLLDRLMGGRDNHPGALSSRFTKKLYVPRPNAETMKRILLRDIKLYGGRDEWADKCLEIAGELNTNDPRTVLSFLDGGDRLMDGHYKEDIVKIYQMQQDEVA